MLGKNLLDNTALLNKIEDINHKFAPFPEGTLLVSCEVISMYPSINNERVYQLVKEL